MQVLNRRVAALLVAAALPLTAIADGVSVRFGLSDSAHTIFPTNRFGVSD